MAIGFGVSDEVPPGRRPRQLPVPFRKRRQITVGLLALVTLGFIGSSIVEVEAIGQHGTYESAPVCRLGADTSSNPPCTTADRAVATVANVTGQLETSGSGKSQDSWVEITFDDPSDLSGGNATFGDDMPPFTSEATKTTVTMEFWQGSVQWLAMAPDGRRYYPDGSTGDETSGIYVVVLVAFGLYVLLICLRWLDLTIGGRLPDHAFLRPLLLVVCLVGGGIGWKLMAGWSVSGVIVTGAVAALVTLLLTPWPRPGRSIRAAAVAWKSGRRGKRGHDAIFR